MAAAWTDLENAVIAALQAAAGPPAGALRTVRSYAGEVEEGPADACGQLPAAFVFIGSGKEGPGNASRTQVKEEVRVSVLVATRHPGGDAALRQGTPAARDAGIYAICEAVRATLHDRRYASYEPLVSRGITGIRRDRELTVYGVDLTTWRKVSVEDLRGVTWPDLNTIRLAYDVDDDAAEEAADRVDTST